MENNGTEKRASNKNIGQNLDAVLLNDGLVRNQVVGSDEKDAAFVHGVRVGRFGEVEVDLEWKPRKIKVKRQIKLKSSGLIFSI